MSSSSKIMSNLSFCSYLYISYINSNPNYFKLSYLMQYIIVNTK